MKSLILTTMLALTTISHAAPKFINEPRWIPFTQDSNNSIHYFDVNNIQTNGTVVKVWMQSDLIQLPVRVEINCKKGAYHFSEGETPVHWIILSPSQVLYELFTIVCFH